MTQKPRNEGALVSKKSKNFAGEHALQTPVDACALGALLWSPSVCFLDSRLDLLKYCIRSGAIWYSFCHLLKVRNYFDEWTTRSDWQSRIMNPSRSRRQHLLPKREGTAKNSRHFASGKHGGGEVSFFYSEDPYLASQRNDRGTTLRFGRHRRPFMQMQLPSIEAWLVRNLWPCTLGEWRRVCFWPTVG